MSDNDKELQERIDYFDDMWKKSQMETISSLADSELETAWKYKNFSNIEDLIGNLLKTDPFDHKSVLSIGCGAGKDLEKIKKIFPYADVYGIDASRHALYEAKRHTDAGLVCAVADYLPFRDDVKFDGFIAGHVFSITPNAKNADKIIGELTKHSAKKSMFYMTFYWDEYVEDGTCPDLELDMCTPVGRALWNSGWELRCGGTQYALQEKSPFARGVFWVDER